MPANLSFISITQAIFLSNFVFHGPVLFVFVAFIAYDTQHRKGKMKFGEMNNSLKKNPFSLLGSFGFCSVTGEKWGTKTFYRQHM